MKKIFILLTIVLVYNSIANAQDVIVLDTPTIDEIKAKIVEVGEREVKYKTWTYQDGPIFTIATNKILYIKYQNGETQRFDSQQNAQNKESSDQEENYTKTTKVKIERNSIFGTRKNTSRWDADIFYAIPDESGDWAFNLGFDMLYAYNVLDNLYVQVGLGYLVGGVEVYEITTSYTDLNIPLAVGYNLPLDSKDRFSLDVKTGPRLNYTIAGKLKSGGNELKFKDIDGVKRFYATWDIGAAIMFYNYGIMLEYWAALKEEKSGIIKLGFKMLF